MIKASRIAMTFRLPKCEKCLYLVKLGVFPENHQFFIGQGCKCGTVSRLSELYENETDARMDLATLSWKS